MVRVNGLPTRTALETYEIFTTLREGFRLEEFNFVLFYGNPTDKEISWCPDCRTAHVDFMRFAKEYEGNARFHTVPIGSREEFNKDNPFLREVPHLDAVPTLAIYKERIEYLKLVDPTFEDLAYLVKRYEV